MSEKGISLDGDLERRLTEDPPMVITDKTFENETVSVDFRKFERCIFHKCKLHVKYGNFRFIDCTLDACELRLELPALGVAALLKVYFKDQPITFQNEEAVIR